jgi:hypothetical protein
MSEEKSLYAFTEPKELDNALRLAGELSKSSLLPEVYHGKPANVLVVMMKAHELGISALQGLTEMHVIKGKAVSSAVLKMALCLRRPEVCTYFTPVESTAEKAVFETHRAGAPKPVKLEWTYQQAIAAGLPSRNPTWKAHPQEMLRARCMSALATAVYPDLVQGLLTGDEAADTVDGIVQNPASDITTVSKTEALTASLKAEKGATTATLPAGSPLKKMQIIEGKPTDAEFEKVEVPKEPVKPEEIAEVAKALKDAPPQTPVSQMQPKPSSADMAKAKAAELAKAQLEKLPLTEPVKAETPWERIQSICKQYGADPKSTMKGIKPGVSPSKLTLDDVGLVRDALEASRGPAPRDEPPPPADDDCPF